MQEFRRKSIPGEQLVTGSSRFLSIILLGSLGPKKANSFLPNPETKRDYANVQLSMTGSSSQGGYHSTRDKEMALRIRVWCCYLGYRATRGLLATDHEILNHGQVTWTTPELAPPSPNYHTNGRTFQLSTDLTCIAALHGLFSVKKNWGK
ncbi:hypothetical protein TNCV_2066651 [Trichonephila clavipes]|uniref:Uncharacterized protein n=1 Tax=Trichonephila clavipes TaxID=2585209 RepID=A0A8X6W306_TRICX|nr:hypothetical protein TNCV_2066651 [Trichonephila clavipes]